MHEFNYCKRCKKIYKLGSDGICSFCLKEHEKIMIRIKEYLEESPLSGVIEISRELDITEKDVLFLLREGRLSLRNDDFKCLRCGENIDTGKYCKTCIKSMKTEFHDVTKSIIGKQSNKKIVNKGEMYTLYRRKED